MMKTIRYTKFSKCTALSLFFIAAFFATQCSALAESQFSQTTQATQPEPERTLWTIDTRTASFCRGTPLAEAGIRVFKKVDGCWQDSSRTELAAVDEKVPLIVFFHGMWLDRAGGRLEGMRLYRLLKQGNPDRPFQFVIWSWPAMQQQRGPRKDVRVKVARTDTQAFYVAQWVETLPKDRPICLVGYSLGARIVSGSLELLAGGDIRGQSLAGLPVENSKSRPENPIFVQSGASRRAISGSFRMGSKDEVRVLRGPEEVRVLRGPHEVQEGVEAGQRRPLRVALVAAAIDNGSLLPGHQNGLALTQVERLLVTQNSSDKILRWYSLLYRRGGPEALGFTGPACLSRLGEEGDRLDVLSVSGSIGRNHYWMNYLRSCALRRELLELALEPTENDEPVVAPLLP